MQLYYKPGACSLASHITLHEIGAEFDLQKVDTNAGTTESGADYTAINPNGYVPALALDGGEILTEGPAILQYLADQKPEAGLAPKSGTLERARLQQHLSFVGSELHKAFSPLFAAEQPAGPARDAVVANIGKKFNTFETILSDGRQYLLGDSFTVADAYLFVVSSWTRPTGIDLGQWPNLAAYVGRIASRPAAQAAMRAEGLLN